MNLQVRRLQSRLIIALRVAATLIEVPVHKFISDLFQPDVC